MPHRGELKCLADGLIDSFMSRNNDSAGYWALGLLYSHALELQKKIVTLTLLGGESTPANSLCEALGTKYGAFSWSACRVEVFHTTGSSRPT